MTALNFNFWRILKLELFKNHENKAIRSLKEPFLNFIINSSSFSYNFSDELWVFSEPSHSDWRCYWQSRNLDLSLPSTYKHLLWTIRHCWSLPSTLKPLYAIDWGVWSLLLRTFSGASSKKRHSFPHKFSNYKVQGEKVFHDPFDWNVPRSKVTDAIHRDGSEHLLDFYLFSSELLFSFGLLKNQKESVVPLHLI